MGLFYSLMKTVVFIVFCTFVFAGAVVSGNLKNDWPRISEKLDDLLKPKNKSFLYNKPKVICCKNNPIYNKTPSLYIIDPDDSVPKLKDDFLLPYIENKAGLFDSSPKQKIKINSKWYSIPEILNSTNEIRKKIMHALQDNIKGDDDLLQVNLVGVKKSKSVFRYKRIQEGFFSSINIKMNMIANSVKKSVDLLSLKDNSGMEDEHVDKFGLEFNFMTDSLWVEFGPIRKKMQLEASIVFDLNFYERQDSLFIVSNFESFNFEFPGMTADVTKDLLLHVEKDHLAISITRTDIDKIEVNDNVVLDDFIDQFYRSMEYYYNSLNEHKIPFLDNDVFLIRGVNYNFSEIGKVVDDYGKIVQFALSEFDDSLKTDFAEVKNKIDSIVEKKIPLGGVAVLNKVLKDEGDEYNDHDFIVLKGDSATKVSGVLQLHEGKNVLVYKIWPKSLKYAKNIDFVSFNAYDPDVQYEIYVKFIVYTTKYKEKWNDSYEGFVDKFVLNFSDRVRSFDIGVFEAKSKIGHPIEFAKMNYNASIKIDSLDGVHPSLVLEPKSLTLNAGDVQVQSLKKRSKDVFRYDFNSDKWVVPGPLMRLTSFSKDDLLEHLYAISNSLSELLNHVDVDSQSKSSLDAAKSVEVVIRNFDKVIFGKDSLNDKNRLVEKTDEKYRKTFSDIYDFANKFNKAWKENFGKNLPGHVCQIKFLDANKKEIPVIGKRLNGKIAYVKVAFNLNFNLRSDLVREFSKILRSQLADLSTESHVQVGKKSNVLFEFVADLRQ